VSTYGICLELVLVPLQVARAKVATAVRGEFFHAKQVPDSLTKSIRYFI